MRPYTRVRLAKAYDYIASYIEREGYGPTIREVSAYLGTSPSGGLRYVEQLALEGKITRRKGKARSIKLTAPADTPNVSQETQEAP